ncbi:MAG: hypothetical protein K8S14_07325 [Actinomycetia bacterium]|nr:hypothetical protein [Actinomycetes bacterium]
MKEEKETKENKLGNTAIFIMKCRPLGLGQNHYHKPDHKVLGCRRTVWPPVGGTKPGAWMEIWIQEQKMSIKDTVKELVLHRGGQFDPDINILLDRNSNT